MKIKKTGKSHTENGLLCNEGNPSDHIENQIAAAVLNATIPALLAFILLSCIATKLAGAGHERRYIPLVIMMFFILVIWVLVRTGRISLAARAYIASMCVAVLSGMIINGGVHALAFSALLPILALVGWLYGDRIAVKFMVVSVFTGGVFVWMDMQGWMREMQPPPALGLWFLSIGYFLLMLAATAIPSRMLRQALSDNEARRLEAERVSRALAEREQTLRESEALRRAVFESSRIPVVVMDRETHKFVDCNPAAVASYGYRSRDETLGRTPMDVSAPIQYGGEPSSELALRYIERAERDGSAVFEWRHRRPDGTEWDAEVHLLSFEAGGVTRLQFSLIDITDRKLAEEALRKSEAKYRDIVENAPIGIFRRDIGGELLYSNPGMIRQFECSTENELLENYGRVSQRWVHMEKHDEFKALLLKNRSVSGYENELRLVNGKIKWFALYAFLDDSDQFINGFSLDITERKQAEQALRASEANYRFLFQHNPAPMLIYESATLKLLAVNDAFQNNYGYATEEIHNMLLTDLYPEDEKEPIADLAADLARQGHVYAGEWHHLKRDGTLISIEAISHNIKFDGREGRIAVISDITQRKKIEEELKERNREFTDLVEAAPYGIVIHRNGIIQYVNPAVIRIIRYRNFDEAIGEKLIDRVHPDSKDLVIERMRQQVLDSRMLPMVEEKLLRKDGDICYADVTTVVGTYMGEKSVFAFFNDITERKQVEDALRMSQERLQLATRALRIGIWDWDIVNNDLIWDDDMYRLYGIQREDFGGAYQAWISCLHPEDRDRAEAEIQAALRGEREYAPEFRIIWPDGSVHYLSAASQTFRDDHGNPLRMIGTNIDITERKLAEERQSRLAEQLHQSQKMDAIGQLAGGVAHDFNNLLTGIMGSAQLLQFAENLSEKQKKYIAMILSAAERAGSLTKKLLTFSKIGTRITTAVDCVKIIKDTVEILQHTLDKSIAITIENRAVHTSIIGDDTLLMNAFMNMGINASHAMPSGGALTFILENYDLDKNYCEASPFNIKPGNFIRIDVRDTGCGIRPEVIPRIFEPFFTTKEQGGGTGLGLSMVYGTVQDHGGAITVYSEQGSGTVFHIYLPVTEDSVPEKINTEALQGGAGTVLLIDDEELIRITAKGFLESLGYSVLTEKNGEDGLKTFIEKRGEIKLIILDMLMPVMGGREAFIRLREIDPEIPILVASGFVKEEQMFLLKEQGFAGFLQKPFRIEELAEKVHKALYN